MAILGNLLAGPSTNNQVIYKVPTGKQATVSVNAVNVANSDVEYTLSLVRTKDNVINSLIIDNPGSGFTDFPPLTINGACTTTATGAVTALRTTGAEIVNKGSGYFPGNVLTITGGTFNPVCRLVVLTVDGAGAIQTVAVQEEGIYTAIPPTEAGHTGGQGSGATFSLLYSLQSATVTNPGNGYDTATVSIGGAGTGAAISVTYGVVTEVTDAIEYLTLLPRRSVLERTGIPLAAGEMITTRASINNSVNVTVYGIEDLA